MTNKTKHSEPWSKGPWELTSIFPDEVQNLHELSNGGAVLGDLRDVKPEDRRLIATAPDWPEAVLKLYKMLEVTADECWQDGDHNTSSLVQEINADVVALFAPLLAKARGEN